MGVAIFVSVTIFVGVTWFKCGHDQYSLWVWFMWVWFYKGRSRQRLEEMRHFYDSTYRSHDPRTLNSSLGMLGGDPFYDRCPWFRLIGRSFVYLSNLLVPFSLVHKVAVVGEKGEVKGHMTVSVRFMEGNVYLNAPSLLYPTLSPSSSPSPLPPSLPPHSLPPSLPTPSLPQRLSCRWMIDHNSLSQL